MRNQAFTRQCCACRCHKNKNELIRLTIQDEIVVIDREFKMEGRGVYICKDLNCVKIAKKKNIINRALKINNNLDIYDLVIKEITNE